MRDVSNCTSLELGLPLFYGEERLQRRAGHFAIIYTKLYRNKWNPHGDSEKMVLTKAYLRYVQSACLGVICSLKANLVFIKRRSSKSASQISQYAACPSLESVVLWDLRRGEKVHWTFSYKAVVWAILIDKDNIHLWFHLTGC